jgi:HPt (histidine-containing phosphotransfer) domain-containing protein
MAQNDIANRAAATTAHGQRPVFDKQATLQRLGNDEPLFLDMIQFFLEDSPGLLEDIRESLEARNAERVIRAAHSLKGLAATFSAHDAVEAARVLEVTNLETDLAGAQQRLVTLEREVKRLCAALALEQATV